MQVLQFQSKFIARREMALISQIYKLRHIKIGFQVLLNVRSRIQYLQ